MCAGSQSCVAYNRLSVRVRMVRIAVNDAVVEQKSKPTLPKLLVVARQQIAAQLVDSDLKYQAGRCTPLDRRIARRLLGKPENRP